MNAPKFLALRFGRTFWSVIVTELFERGAWYGFFTIAVLYLTGNANEGALGLTHQQAGTILGVVPFFLYIFPLFAGTIGEKIGYKRMLLASYVILAAGYYLCSTASGYGSFFAYFLLVALGAGMFKPMVTATVAQVTRGNEEKSSVGFGVFYAVVNAGGFIGPVVAGSFRPVIDENTGAVLSGNWNTLFYLSASYMVAMFFWILFMYREPTRRGGDPLGTKLREMITDLKNPRLAFLLIILVGYWTNYVQFFNTMPLWITEWVDTSVLTKLPIPHAWISAGQLKAEYLINLNGLTIVLTSVWLTSRTAKTSILKVMNGGTLVLCLAVAGLALTSPMATGALSLWLLCGLIITFSMAEVCVNPKSNELMGRIAPRDKVGTYQGYMFLSVACGFFFGGKLVGLYGHFADKTAMYHKALIERGSTVPDIDTLSLTKAGVELQKMGVDLHQLNQQLWHDYRPYLFWLICASIGITSVILLAVYRHFVPQLEEDTSS